MKTTVKQISEIIKKYRAEIETFQSGLFGIILSEPVISYLNSRAASDDAYQIATMRYDSLENKILVFSPSVATLIAHQPEEYAENEIRVRIAHEQGHRYHLNVNNDLLQLDLELHKRKRENEFTVLDWVKNLNARIFGESVANYSTLQYCRDNNIVNFFEKVKIIWMHHFQNLRKNHSTKRQSSKIFQLQNYLSDQV